MEMENKKIIIALKCKGMPIVFLILIVCFFSWWPLWPMVQNLQLRIYSGIPALKEIRRMARKSFKHIQMAMLCDQ